MWPGEERALAEFSRYLFLDLKIPEFELKKSFSDYPPFKRFLVKVKKEIIATGITSLNPTTEKAEYIDPHALRELYANNQDFVILDTRNDYEIALGKFRNSKNLGVTSFRKFIAKLEDLPGDWANQTVVTYCTGGIRCEKAALLLKRRGFKDVKQLRGGILKYFEDCGSENFEGECFVFDKRIGVDAGLSETSTTQCYACRAPLLPDDLKSEFYVYGKSCGSCKKILPQTT